MVVIFIAGRKSDKAGGKISYTTPTGIAVAVLLQKFNG
jgi:hypothetical protein